MFLNINQIKQHLNIDADYPMDDDYLIQLAEVSEQIVLKHIDEKLSDIAEREGGELPKPLLQAMLLLIATFYNSRESVTYGATPIEVPLTFNYILSLYKNYNNTKISISIKFIEISQNFHKRSSKKFFLFYLRSEFVFSS